MNFFDIFLNCFRSCILDAIDVSLIAALVSALSATEACQRCISSRRSEALKYETLCSLYSSALEVDLRSFNAEDMEKLRSHVGIVAVQGKLSPDNCEPLQFVTQIRSGMLKANAVASFKLNFEEKSSVRDGFILAEVETVPCKLKSSNNVGGTVMPNNPISVAIDTTDLTCALRATVSDITNALGKSRELLCIDPLQNVSVETGVFSCSVAKDMPRSWGDWWNGRVQRCVRLFIPLGANCTVIGKIIVDAGGLRIAAHPIVGFGVFRMAPFEV